MIAHRAGTRAGALLAVGAIALGLWACESTRTRDRGRAHAPAGAGAGAATAAADETPTPALAEPTATPAPRSDRDLVASLDALTGGSLSDADIAQWTARVSQAPGALDQLIETLVNNPRLGRELIPSLVFGTYVNVRNYYALPTGYIMQETEPDDHGLVVYYIRKPCKSSDAVPVKPWWDPRRPILVCPDAYRPDAWTIEPNKKGYHSTQLLACDSQVGSPENEVTPHCGCGPALFRCLRDQTQYLAMSASMQDEVKRTTQYVVSHDLPVESLFTGNPTFHDRNMEYYYRRQKVGSLHLTDVNKAMGGVKDWPADGKWARREELVPGQHAGLLTAPQLLHWLPDRRQRQRGFFEMLWCEGRNSFGATTKQVLALNQHSANLAFVHDSWKRLAQTPLCTNCHAKLDYGFQFFMGYPDSRASVHYIPSLVRHGKGPMYANNIDDPRGETELNPESFARLAVKQPEFLRCMSGHVVKHVLGPDAPAADFKAVQDDMAVHHSFKSAMRLALHLYTDRWKTGTDARPPSALPAAPAEEPTGATGKRTTAAPAAPERAVTVTAPLRAELDEYCTMCHNHVPFVDVSVAAGRPFDLTTPTLARKLAVRMADQLAYDQMPRSPVHMPRAARDRLLRDLIAALWTDAAARAEATRYYLAQDQGLPAQPIDNALHLVRRAAGAGDQGAPAWGLLERALWIDQSSFTSGFAATVGLEALRVCREQAKKSGHAATDQELDSCLEQATDPTRLVRGPTN